MKSLPGFTCAHCEKTFDVEEADARMAPAAPLAVAQSEAPFAVRDGKDEVVCPHCCHRFGVPSPASRSEWKKKKVNLTLLVHPEWLAGSQGVGPDGREYGGRATDTPEATVAWNRERAARLRLLEVRGHLPEEVPCPETGLVFRSGARGGTLSRRGQFQCGSRGRAQSLVECLQATGKTAPIAVFAIQGYCPECARQGRPYGGRFFRVPSDCASTDAALREWILRSSTDLSGFWPTSEIPFGHMTHQRQPLPQHGYTHWWTMFNPRQLLVHSQLLRAIATVGQGRYSWELREFVLGAFQQYLRNQNMMVFWHLSHDHFAPALSNANFHPKTTVVEVGVFPRVGYGPWPSTLGSLFDTADWREKPWDLGSTVRLGRNVPELGSASSKSKKILCEDPLDNSADIACCSATELSTLVGGSYDLVITDPPFGDNLHYAELADFFHVWLRLVLKDRYPKLFGPEYSPNALEAVSNRARQPDDPDGFYRRLLTQSWREAHRILKPGGLLAFTFHHNLDEPWVDVLESLFEAGFYLEATYPIRSDETKGKGEFGSKKIEYDIIHVCRKRHDEPKPLSWARMRRELLDDIRHLQSILEHHAKAGLPPADLQVIRCGKALEYYSRHYGKVYVDEGRPFTLRDALLGINQLLDEDAGKKKDVPPVGAEPFTRQFLGIFDGTAEQPRDQMQKFLRGTGIAPAEFEERGWCREEKRVYRLAPPLEIAQGRERGNLTADYDQAMSLIGACVEGSGINALDTLKNGNFKPHPALEALLEWHRGHAASSAVRDAASRALTIFRKWKDSLEKARLQQLTLFPEES